MEWYYNIIDTYIHTFINKRIQNARVGEVEINIAVWRQKSRFFEFTIILFNYVIEIAIYINKKIYYN